MKLLNLSLLAASLLLLAPGAPVPLCASAEQATASTYGQLQQLYERNKFGDVVKDGQALIASLPPGHADLPRLRILVSVAAAKWQPIFSVADQLKEVSRVLPESAVAATNYGAAQMIVGDRALAGAMFQKALQIDSRDFYAHLGLAEVDALDVKIGLDRARGELALARACAHSAEQWSALGDHYLLFDDMTNALEAFNHAEKDSDLSAALKAHVNLAIYRLALKSNQIDLARGRLEGVLAQPSLPLETYILSVKKLCPGDEALSKRLYEKALATSGNDDDLFYALGRAFDKIGQPALASLCLNRAYEQDRGDSKFALAWAVHLSMSGENVAARRELVALVSRGKTQEPTPQRLMAQGLAEAGLVLLAPYKADLAQAIKESLPMTRSKPSTYHSAFAELQNIKCHCRLLTMQYTMRMQPGVAFSYIPDDKQPVAFIIYDSARNTPLKVWQSLKDEARALPMPQSQTYSDFATMATAALDYAEAPYRPRTPSYIFNPLPMQLMAEK